MIIFDEYESMFEIKADMIDDKPKWGKHIGDYARGKKAFLVVNGASNDLLFTDKNYRQLAKLQKDFGPERLQIMIFPTDQFGPFMEYDNNADIKKAIEQYSKDFWIYDKVNVNGNFPFGNPHDLFKFLRTKPKELQFANNNSGGVPWNFAKYLLDQDGKFVKYFDPTISPKDIRADTLPLLK